jgi:hypothetical protein
VVTVSKKPYSRAVWDALTNDAASAETWLKHLERLDYDSSEALVTKLKQRIKLMSSRSNLLVLGPSKTSEALFLDGQLTDMPKHVHFISTFISTSNKFDHLKLATACLPDEERIDRLAFVRPPAWMSLRALFIGPADNWGERLKTKLERAGTNLCLSLRSMMIGQTNNPVDAAAECYAEKFPLIFLAAEDSSDIAYFFTECERQVANGGKPYRPFVCLLGDFNFSNRASVDSLDTSRWAKRFAITMVSESVVTTNEVDTGDQYFQLSQDFCAVARNVWSMASEDPESFCTKLSSAFSPGGREFLEGVSIRKSHYFRFLQKQPDAHFSCSLKWLECSPFGRGPVSWRDKNQPAGLLTAKAFEWDLLCVRVPWLNSWRWMGLAFLALAIGISLEIPKRHIYLEKRWWPVTWRCLVYVVLTLTLFCAVIYAFESGWLGNPDLSGLLFLCISPLALLPVLQHIAVLKFPGLRSMVQFPSKLLEDALHRCINSRSKHLLDKYRRSVKSRIEIGFPKAEDDLLLQGKAEYYLWEWWYLDLRKLNPSRAQKIFDRYVLRIRVWDKKLATGARIEELEEAVAYTKMVLGEPFNAQDGPAEVNGATAAPSGPSITT